MNLIKSDFAEESKYYVDTDTRYIDCDNDIYPPPLMTNYPSQKVKEFDRIRFAIWYLQVNRVRELLIELKDCDQLPKKQQEEFNLFGKDYYGGNIISLICARNHPTNIFYENNKQVYELLFFTVLNTITKSQLDILFNQLYTDKMAWKELLINNLIKECNNRPYFLIALWNYGVIFQQEYFKDFTYEPLKSKLLTTYKENEEKNNQFQEFEPGKRYLNLLINYKCPITYEKIHKPAFLIDGTFYEFIAIDKHLKSSNKNPLTNENLLCKTIYLPTENRFIHYNYIN